MKLLLCTKKGKLESSLPNLLILTAYKPTLHHLEYKDYFKSGK